MTFVLRNNRIKWAESFLKHRTPDERKILLVFQAQVNSRLLDTPSPLALTAEKIGALLPTIAKTAQADVQNAARLLSPVIDQLLADLTARYAEPVVRQPSVREQGKITKRKPAARKALSTPNLPEDYWTKQRRQFLVISIDQRGMSIPSLIVDISRVAGREFSEDEIDAQLSIGRTEAAAQATTSDAVDVAQPTSNGTMDLSVADAVRASVAASLLPKGYWGRKHRLQALVELSDKGMDDAQMAAFVRECTGHHIAEKRIGSLKALVIKKVSRQLTSTSRTGTKEPVQLSTRLHYRKIFALNDFEKAIMAERILKAADKRLKTSKAAVKPAEEQAREPKPAVDISRLDIKQKIEAQIPALRRYARALTRNVVAADDLVQDAIARGLDKIHLWEEGTNLGAWLFRILHNQYVNIVRKSVREGKHVNVDDVGEHDGFGNLITQEASSGKLEWRDFLKAYAEIPAEQQTVIFLVGIKGLSYEEVAEIVGIPTGTVRSRLWRGREALRYLRDIRSNGEEDGAILTGNALWQERQRRLHPDEPAKIGKSDYPSRGSCAAPVKLLTGPGFGEAA